MSDTPYSLLERLARNGSPDDWSALVALYRPLLTTWVRPHVGQDSDADDIVQETLAVVVRKFPEFRHNGTSGSFRAWLRAVLVNKLRQFRRSAGRNPDFANPTADRALAALEQHDSAESRGWDAEHDRQILSRLLNRIRAEFAPTTWEVFRRYVLEGHSPKAVAAAVGVTANAVFIARSRVLKRLREEAAGLIALDE
jgi:RNA polymerase sigma factor (sigma-70 family)